MRTEPELDRRVLVDLLRDRYALDIERLDFIPLGIVRPAVVGATPRGAELPLLAALAEVGRVSVARPLPDRAGRLMSAVGGYEIAVLEYLEGRSLEDEATWPDALYGRVAEAVAAIHASTDAVRHLVPRVERFELPFLTSFARTLAALQAGRPVADDEAMPIELRDLVGPRAVELQAGIERLTDLRDGARTRGRRQVAEEVLCHTDLWGSNLLLADDGTLHVLDWDGALLGPPEHDLFMFAGTGFFPAERLGWFLDRYEAAFRPVRLSADLLAFYLYRRSFEDLAGFVRDLADGTEDAMGAPETLAIVAGIIDDVLRLEERVLHVREVLRARA